MKRSVWLQGPSWISRQSYIAGDFFHFFEIKNIEEEERAEVKTYPKAELVTWVAIHDELGIEKTIE